MERKMFGHRMKKPHSSMNKRESMKWGEDKDGPPGYEGKEHVRYEDPGYSSHEIDFPEDEPHMKSHVSEDESHEAEDNYHMDVPDQTHYDLEKKIKRAHMKMDDEDEIENPAPLRGNIVRNVGYEGEEDTSGEEEMGPHDMQKDKMSHDGMPKKHRKKMIVAVMKRKMKKREGMNSSY